MGDVGDTSDGGATVCPVSVLRRVNPELMKAIDGGRKAIRESKAAKAKWEQRRGWHQKG